MRVIGVFSPAGCETLTLCLFSVCLFFLTLTVTRSPGVIPGREGEEGLTTCVCVCLYLCKRLQNAECSGTERHQPAAIGIEVSLLSHTCFACTRGATAGGPFLHRTPVKPLLDPIPTSLGLGTLLVCSSSSSLTSRAGTFATLPQDPLQRAVAAAWV